MAADTSTAHRYDQLSIARHANDDLVPRANARCAHLGNRQGHLILGRDSWHAFTLAS